MYKFRTMLTKLHSDTKAVTALEYGLIAALIATVIITSVTTLGTNLSTTFSNIAGHFTASLGK